MQYGDGEGGGTTYVGDWVGDKKHGHGAMEWRELRELNVCRRVAQCFDERPVTKPREGVRARGEGAERHADCPDVCGWTVRLVRH